MNRLNGATKRATATQSILIVEDEQIVALDMRVRLERFGYSVSGMFTCAEEAIDYLESRDSSLPECVLMDINLQGEMDGITAANIVRERFGLPVIIITAYADEETIERAKASEPFAYIIKPFDDRELRTSIVISLYRHSMEHRVQERERLLSGILGSIDSGVIVADAEEKIAFSNDLAGELIGKPIDIGNPIDGFIPDSTLNAARENGAARWVLTSADTGERTLHFSVHRLRDFSHESDPVSGEVWVVQDISQRLADERAIREKDEQLAHAEKMDAVGRISGGLAHDFNNLVTIIMGYSRLAIDDIERGSPPSEIKRNVEGVYETARRSSDLTRQLLAFSRVESINPTSNAIDVSLEASMEIIRGIVPENIQIEFTLHASNARAMIDPARLEQIVLNLLLNARDAMPKGGNIVVSTEVVHLEEQLNVYVRELEPGDYVRLEVVDTGMGIDAETLPHVFEPFFSTKDRMHGSGFGLATVYASVEDAGGAIEIASTVGRGTTFSVYLPAVDVDAHRLDRGERLEEVARGTEMVLVVQEEDGIRQLVTRVLRSHGYVPVAARSVGDALLILERTPETRAIVTDLSAPYLSAGEIIYRFRAAAPPAAALLLTVSGGVEEAGQDATLRKPFEPIQLLRSLRETIDRRLNSVKTS